VEEQASAYKEYEDTLFINFMQGIDNYIPETNHVSNL
jgi:hypothetical protein